ncbi:MAG: serine acetyltransferase [Carboxylicivirga sp.]|jgi:serine O-acetyltransferase|nr:serine acetyltransferase [Carboxylicivirga sp.]
MIKNKIKDLYIKNRLLHFLLFVPVRIYQKTYIFYIKHIKELYFSLKYYNSDRLYRLNDLTIGIKKLGESKTLFPHPIGMVIGWNVVMGENCTIYQNVTIGARTNDEGYLGKYPKIGSNVTIGCNAVIIGDIKVGNNVQIGAATLVNCDIPDNATVVGNPCRIISA